MKISQSNNYLKILIISFLAIALDFIFIVKNISSPPAWDQGYHIANVFKMYNIIENSDINLTSKLSNILDVSNTYRGPLTYLFSSIFLKLFGKSYTTVFLSNNIFNFLCILSMYKICEIYNQKKVGIWSTIIFTFSPFIFIQRTDYLLDLSLTAFSMLFFAMLTLWFNCKKNFSKYSFISGISLGLLFLVKPTGIVIFTIPIIFNFIKRLGLNNKFIFFKELLSFCLTFILILIPWFSRHWITILSSISNAWNWGIKYQDGLEANSIESWFYYFKIIPLYIGYPLFIFILILFVSKILNFKQNKKILIRFSKSKHIWFFSLLLNSYLILSLMSTKDPRFLLPIYPIICIYLSILINQFNKNNFINHTKKIIIIILLMISFISKIEFDKSLKLSNNILNYYVNWPHQELIKTIYNENQKINQTLAVLPDTKEVNTFNLEAEALRQGESVTVRQIISNKENFKSDLKYFDWFLLKSGDQGVMTNEAKILLNNYLLNSDSFFTLRKWFLPDKTELLLLRRNNLNSVISEKECDSNKPYLKTSQFENGIKIDLFAKGVNINNANLLIDIKNKNSKREINLSLLNGRLIKPLPTEECYQVSQRIPFKFNIDKAKDEFNINSYIINNENKKWSIPKTQIILSNYSSDKNNHILYENKIDTVKELGNLIKIGDFQKLFYLVGILNQSDPDQTYLRDAEEIYSIRYKNEPSLNNLYAILAAQILRKDPKNAQKTVRQIIDQDQLNGNPYIAKTVIEIYQFKLREAKNSIYFAKSLNNKSEQSKKLIDDLLKVFKYF